MPVHWSVTGYPIVLDDFLDQRSFKIAIFQKLLPQHKIKKIEDYFDKYHAKTLFLGRFIPFGVRNVLFFTTGLSPDQIYKVPYCRRMRIVYNISYSILHWLFVRRKLQTNIPLSKSL